MISRVRNEVLGHEFLVLPVNFMSLLKVSFDYSFSGQLYIYLLMTSQHSNMCLSAFEPRLASFLLLIRAPGNATAQLLRGELA